MSRRAAQVDEQATKERKFEDWLSFISRDGHEYLYGEDKTRRRREVWIRDEKRCVKCGIRVSLETMEMDHRQGGLVGRCDCLTCNRHGDGRGNLQAMCNTGCHTGSEFSKHR